MKSLLLLAYHFPPAPVAGAVRTGIIAKHLARLGWRVTVLTAESGNSETDADVVYVPDPLKRNIRGQEGREQTHRAKGPVGVLARNAVDALHFPDRQVAWLPALLRTANRLAAAKHFDAILSSALPFTVHIAAARLSRRLGIPWIADYRDLYAGNPYVPRMRSGELAALFERRILRRASVITTVSESLAGELRKLHRYIPVEVIPNAVDLEDVLEATIPPREFRICYTGALYGGRRNPEPLFEAIVKLQRAGHEAGSNLRVDFYGPDYAHVSQLVERYDLRRTVRAHGLVPQAVARQAQRDAAVLLIILNMAPETANEYGSKILEYTAVRRPILTLGPQASVLKPLITENGLGFFVTNADECERALVALYEQFKAGVYNSKPANGFHLYGAPDLVAAFESVLQKVTA